MLKDNWFKCMSFLNNLVKEENWKCRFLLFNIFRRWTLHNFFVALSNIHLFTFPNTLCSAIHLLGRLFDGSLSCLQHALWVSHFLTFLSSSCVPKISTVFFSESKYKCPFHSYFSLRMRNLWAEFEFQCGLLLSLTCK